MISFDEAYAIIMGAARPLGVEIVPLPESAGRVLAGEIVSDVDMPPFDKAAMDGYACRSTDVGGELTVIEEIPAGHAPSRGVGPGECSRIMTGAPVPEGADRVVMVEESQVTGSGRVRLDGARRGSNICPRGEDVRKGDVVLRQGTLLTAARMGILCAAHGKPGVPVSRRPRVAILATGDELVEPWETPPAAGIRNTNSYQLSAGLARMGAEVTACELVADRYDGILAVIRRHAATADLLLVSGGVSVGTRDFVAGASEESGFSLTVKGVAMQPGKPVVFGTGPHGWCCGMPGNPVATFVVFERLIKPFLYRLMGHAYAPLEVVADLEQEVARKDASRQLTLPVAFTAPGKVTPLEYHGSAHLIPIARADGLLTIPVGVTRIEKGTRVHVRPV